MIWKAFKLGTLAIGGSMIVGGALLGTDLFSYVRSSARSVRVAVKNEVPVEFEIRRARDLLDEMGPEMRENVRLVAQEEVEIAGLKSELNRARHDLADEQLRVQKLRDCLSTSQTSYSFGDFSYSRDQLKQELARRFDRFKEAETALGSKQRLLENRHKALQGAMDMLERARSQKVALESEIEGLEAQSRLIAAASTGSQVQIDNSKLAQAQKVVGEIRKQLDVTEHVLAHEAKFTEPMPIDVVNEKDLVSQVDAHFAGHDAPAAPAVASAPASPVPPDAAQARSGN